jgi:hypothetical protein
MIDIVVIRGAGLAQGDDIVEPLLSTLAAALARGEHELNETATGKVSRTANIPFTPGIEPGCMVYVHDEFLEEDYVGRVDNVDINVIATPPSATMRVDMSVPEAFFTPSEVLAR